MARNNYNDSDKTFKVVLGVWIAYAIVCLTVAVAATWFVIWVVIQLLEHFQII